MRVYHSSSVRVERPNQHDAGYHAILEAKYARIIEGISNYPLCRMTTILIFYDNRFPFQEFPV